MTRLRQEASPDTADLAARDAKILALYREDVPRKDIAERCGVTLNIVENTIKLARKVAQAGQGTALLRYDAARQALAEARSYDEVRDWEDKAAAIREYARRSRNRELEIDAAEIRVRAQRRRGELLAEMRAAGLLSEGRKKLSTADDSFAGRLTLAELDTTADESSDAQRLAKIPADSFERLAARCRARLENDPRAHSFDVLRERDGPVNGARSVMGSRAEPDDSLDFFPTPPWATRALIEHVLPEIGVTAQPFGSVWEPACGEGHMAAVLAEYADRVVATDIFDYGYGDGIVDFTTAKLELGPDVAWIVTNPPFGDQAEAFVVRAIERANIGVAMFFRLQWLETIGRFERIFRPYPPVVIAQFAERVPLHKGRWEPDGSTATAYLWIVWIKDRVPRGKTEFYWIPPGCKDALTKPDDHERFTAHPVLPRGRTAEGEPYDTDTGELIESQAKADDEAEAGPSTEAPGADEERPVQTADAELASRPAGGRTPAATSEHGRDSRERPAPSSEDEVQIPAFMLCSEKAA